jgi:hypothetical protein
VFTADAGGLVLIHVLGPIYVLWDEAVGTVEVEAAFV